MTVKVVVPDFGESIVEATVVEWLKKEGDPVTVGEAVVVLETDKTNVEVGVEKSGVLARIERQEGEDVRVGDVLAVIEEAADGAEPAPPALQAASAPAEAGAASPANAAAPKVTPVARRMAQEQGVDLAQVAASGASSRVTKDDVQRYLKAQEAAEAFHEPAPAAPPAPSLASAPATPAAAPPSIAAPAQREARAREARVRMSRRRRTIAQRLVEAQRTAAMLTTFNEIDMSAVMDLRSRRKEAFKERYGVSLGIASFFVKAAVGALREFPALNAEVDGEDILYKYYYDIGMAIAAPEGLVVPVLRDADRMTFAEIERKIKDYAQQAQENTLALEDLRGGTFTITNGGVFGSLMSTPILNPPQVGILGLHKIEPRPVAVNGEVAVRPMMYVALSYDHRLVDGQDSVRFLVRVKELIEDPEKLLLEG